MVDDPISDCGCLLCPCLRPVLMMPRRPRILWSRSPGTKVRSRPARTKLGCPRMLASGTQGTSASTNPRGVSVSMSIWGSVHKRLMRGLGVVRKRLKPTKFQRSRILGTRLKSMSVGSPRRFCVLRSLLLGPAKPPRPRFLGVPFRPQASRARPTSV